MKLVHVMQQRINAGKEDEPKTAGDWREVAKAMGEDAARAHDTLKNKWVTLRSK